MLEAGALAPASAASFCGAMALPHLKALLTICRIIEPSGTSDVQILNPTAMEPHGAGKRAGYPAN